MSDYEAAIQAGADAIYNLVVTERDTSGHDVAKAVIDAAITSGQLLPAEAYHWGRSDGDTLARMRAETEVERLRDENKQLKRAVGELDEERQRLRDAIRAHAEEWAWSPDSGWSRRRGPVLDDEEATGATT